MDAQTVIRRRYDVLQDKLEPTGAPAQKKSALWRFEPEIRRLIGEGWSYRQIAEALAKAGVTVSVSWLQRWGRTHLGRVRGAAPAGRTGTVPAGIPPPERAGSAGPLAREGAKSMEELLSEASEAASAKSKVTKPKATGADPVADLLRKLK